MKTVVWHELSESEKEQVLTRPALTSRLDIHGIVTDIVTRIKAEKDKALLEFTAKLDHVEDGRLKLTEQDIADACSRVPEALKEALQHAYRNISAFHKAQIPGSVKVTTEPGVTCEMHYHAIDNIGLYVPGGSAPLVSTVLMLGVPAQIAGCRKVILCSPPKIADEIVYAATLCGIKDIFNIGGAQAIAAMAYGTETVPKVDKVFGPGNAFVTEAKRQVSTDYKGASIDMPAGPSEVMVMADNTSDPEFVASDLLSQAEHGPDSQVMLITESRELADAVNKEVDRQVAELPRRKSAESSLSHSRVIIAGTPDEACAIACRYAPEHLIMQMRDARAYLPKIRNCGSIFIGYYTPESAGDYASGTNHTLPTYGYAKTYSSLGLTDFMRHYTVQELSKDGVEALKDTIVQMTNAEGLMAHQRAILTRARKIEQGN